ncbi:hypothetical protein [Arenibacter sp. H213]|uniref:Neutral/alkaline non-lysosomal ceramidase, N-terminal n=1 Tax=Arenibacter antarcticus TaxID=2040469 RepID=A0ABW5VFK7_9FLAO|nr:hypothetical protein [Arenibacter sp. H213]
MKIRFLRIPLSTTFRITLLFLCLPSSMVIGSELYIGAAEVNITPKLPVALMGQFHLRIADEIHTPLRAGIVALETRNGAVGQDTAIFVSCDLIWISTKMWNQVRSAVEEKIPGFNGNKIILNGTLTHTGPVIEDLTDEAAYFYYNIPKENVTQVSEYRQFLVSQITKGILQAWEGRQKGSTTWGVRRAAIPYNRRVVYKDGSAAMYGNTMTPEFEGIEGYEDHDVNSLYFWNEKGGLISIGVNVSCPSQQVEGDTRIDADFWHPVREKLKARFGSKLVVVGWAGAAGDQSPRPIYRKAALERMAELSGENRMDDVSRRIADAVEITYEIVKDDLQKDILLEHHYKEIELPMRLISVDEYIESKRVSEDTRMQIEQDSAQSDQLYVKMLWNDAIVKRYEVQKQIPNPQHKTEIHAIRLGDIAICTNQFELFTDYGIQIKARSKALQTFVIQLAGPGSYLPTEKAVYGGSYSAICQSNFVGPEGELFWLKKRWR